MLITHLEENIYSSAREIIEYVWEEFEVMYSTAGMTNWLKAHGFSYKKPSITPGKADRKAQEKWIKEYEELKKKSLHRRSYFLHGWCSSNAQHQTFLRVD